MPTIRTNEELPQKNILIRAIIVRDEDSTFPLVIQPAKIVFDAKDSTSTVSFTITNKSPESLAPKIVGTAREMFGVTLPKEIKAHGSAVGTVRLKMVGRKGNFEKSVTLELNDKSKSRFTIPVKRIGQAPVPAPNTGKGGR